MTSETSPQLLPKRLYSLDLTRALASLAVVLVHWDLIAGHGNFADIDIVRSDLPFYAVLAPLFDAGYLAVDYFFLLSGFVFFWLYGDAITERRVGFWKYSILRLTRIYPLHILTLVAVAVLQLLHASHGGSMFKASHQDLYHLGLHLSFLYPWFKQGQAFNLPAWTICVEVLLYFAFFLFAVVTARRLWQIAAVCAAGVVIELLGIHSLGAGLIGFFGGGLTYRLCCWLRTHANARRDWAILAATLVLWTGLYTYWCVTWEGKNPVTGISLLAIQLGLFPLTVVALVTAESMRGHLGRRLAWMGDITYSSYLLHFPMLILLSWMILEFGWDPEKTTVSTVALAGFYAILIPLSLVCYRWFERPAMQKLRSRFLSKTPKKAHKQQETTPSSATPASSIS